MTQQDSRGRLGRCRTWEEVKFVHNIDSDALAERMNKLARAGWFVDDPKLEDEDAGPYGSKTFTIKATRDWCICGQDIDPDTEV